LDLHETWKDIRLLIVDELFTMTGKHFAGIEQQLRDCGRTSGSSHSLFGGIGVVLTGDHHQSRPINGAPLIQGNGDTRYGTAADAASRTATLARLEHRKNPPPSTTRTFVTRIVWCYVIVWATLLSTPCFRVAPQKINNSSSDGAPTTRCAMAATTLGRRSPIAASAPSSAA
jgi:hypothetical protein